MSMDRNHILDIMHMSKDGAISKRRIKVLQVGEASLGAYCHLRGSRRIFTIDNVLALVPVIRT
ncbi:transcriptional regulator [Sporosarcina sp. ANT_H38]|nr:transcriptional regulator [Sporosarcina sp. ANT_H38]